MIWTISAVMASMCTVGQSAFTKLASSKGASVGQMRFNALKIGASLLFFLLISFYNMRFHLPTVACQQTLKKFDKIQFK